MAENLWIQKKQQALIDQSTKDYNQQFGQNALPVSTQVSPDQATVGAQVDQLRGSDNFQSAFNKLKKLPSTIPQMTQETKDVYNKYNRFLKFAGATTGDYSGSSAFQSGLTSALDMDMIQDLLEEQRENTFARQFDDMLPFIKNRRDVTKFALGVNANLKETEKAQDVWMKSRLDMSYANQVQDFRESVRNENTNIALGAAVNLIESVEGIEGREMTTADQRKVLTDALFGNNPATGEPWVALDKANVQALLTGIDAILDTSGGLTSTPSYITFTNKFSDDKGKDGYKSTKRLLEDVGVRPDQYRIKGGEIIINPRTEFSIDQTDQGTSLALQQLRQRGASWYPVTSGGTRMRLRNRNTLQPIGEPFDDSNPGVMDQMRKWANDNNAEIIPDMDAPAWDRARFDVDPSQLGQYRSQYNSASRIHEAAKEGLTLVDLGAAAGKGKLQYTLTHLKEYAADMAGLGKELQVIEETDSQGNLTTRTETPAEHDKKIATKVLTDARALAEEVLVAAQKDLERNPKGKYVKENMRMATKVMDQIEHELYNLPKDQYEAHVYLKYLQVSLQAQVARMHIEKDRMLASFYNAVKGTLDFTGWFTTTKQVRSILTAVRNQSGRIAQQKLDLITPKEKSTVRQDPYGTFYEEGQGQPQYGQSGVSTREQELIQQLQDLGIVIE